MKQIIGGILAVLLLGLLAACAPAVIVSPTAAPTPTATIAPSATPVPPTPTDGPDAGSVDVGGRSINYRCAGHGSPTVIIEPGFGAAGAGDRAWSVIIGAVQSKTRICAYDRANLGLSDPAEGPRTSQDAADDLHALLVEAGIQGPYILVANSIGGWHSRVFIEQHRHEVVGLLLVDSSHPDQIEAFKAAFPEPEPDESASVTRARQQLIEPYVLQNPEHLDFEASAEQVRATGPFGDLSLIVLSQDPTIDIPGVPPDLTATFGPVWEDLQTDLATLSTHSRREVVAGAGHLIHFDQPQAVIEAIAELLATARGE